MFSRNHKQKTQITKDAITKSHWIKNNTQQKQNKQKLHKKDPFPLIEKENLTDTLYLVDFVARAFE